MVSGGLGRAMYKAIMEEIVYNIFYQHAVFSPPNDKNTGTG